MPTSSHTPATTEMIGALASMPVLAAATPMSVTTTPDLISHSGRWDLPRNR